MYLRKANPYYRNSANAFDSTVSRYANGTVVQALILLATGLSSGHNVANETTMSFCRVTTFVLGLVKSIDETSSFRVSTAIPLLLKRTTVGNQITFQTALVLQAIQYPRLF